MRLAGAVALVTGGSSGIGAAIARALSAAGARLLIAGRDPSRLAEVAQATAGVALEADLTEPSGPADLAKAALRAAGHVDLLVSNAGIGWAGPIGEITEAKVNELITVNLTAPIQLTRLLAPSMVERRRGRIVFVSSIAGATGACHEAVYAAAKAGLLGFAESLSYELRDGGVGVSLIIPGVVDTPFFERRGRAYHRRWPALIPAERIAEAVVWATEHDQCEVFVPGWMWLPVRLHGIAPAIFRNLATRFDGPRRRKRPVARPAAPGTNL